MRISGLILLGASILGIVIVSIARLAGVQAVGNNAYLVMFILAAGGILLYRLSIRPPSEIEPTPTEDDAEMVEAQLTRLVSHLQNINTNSENLAADEVRRAIDDQLAPDLNGCLTSPEALSRCFGLAPYAEFMSRLSEGRRNIDLARQATSLGNLEDVWDNLGSAEACMIDAQALLKRCRTRTEHPSQN